MSRKVCGTEPRVVLRVEVALDREVAPSFSSCAIAPGTGGIRPASCRRSTPLGARPVARDRESDRPRSGSSASSVAAVVGIVHLRNACASGARTPDWYPSLPSIRGSCPRPLAGHARWCRELGAAPRAAVPASAVEPGVCSISLAWWFSPAEGVIAPQAHAAGPRGRSALRHDSCTSESAPELAHVVHGVARC